MRPVTAKCYAHRNGEYDAPQLPGYYWFRGRYASISSLATVVLVIGERAFDTITMTDFGYGNFKAMALERGWGAPDGGDSLYMFPGRWWGPIPLPEEWVTHE